MKASLSIVPANDPEQALRLRRMFIGWGSYLLTFILVLACWRLGYIGNSIVAGYVAIVVAVNIAFYAIIRSGMNLRFSDPSLTLAQLAFSFPGPIFVMYHAGPARATFVVLALGAFVFGLLKFRTRDYAILSVLGLAGYALVIALLAANRPHEIQLQVELLQWLAFTAVLVQMSGVGGYIGKLRRRIRESNKELAERNLALQRQAEEQQQLIKQLQDTQAQLLQSEKMASIGQLAAGVAHEINNPIGFVNSNMGTLKVYLGTLVRLIDRYDQALTRLPNHADIAAPVAQLKQEAEFDYLKDDATALVDESMDGLRRVTGIVQALKGFSHVGESDWQHADLHAGLDSTLLIASNEYKYKATVQKDYGDLPAVKCLAGQLNQVFMNLIVNAAQAIKESGIITVRTRCDGDWVRVEIGDNGSGIAADTLPRIFEPFFTTKPIGAGTGLGLSLSYNIVQAHGGKIGVDSEIGKGTRFTVHLPTKPPVAASDNLSDR